MRRTNIALACSLLALVLTGVGWFRPEIEVRLGRRTQSNVVSTPTTVTSAYAASVAQGTKAPTPTLVSLKTTCPSGQPDYHKRLLGDEGAPLGGYVTLDQWKDPQGCFLEVRRYIAEGGVWYYSAIIDDDHRTTPVIRLPSDDGSQYLVIRISVDYKLTYSVEPR